MVFGIGRKKVEQIPALIEARSFYGFAFHFVATEEQGIHGRVAICGYDNCLDASAVREVTRETIASSWENQHDSWHWCRGCVAALFDLGDIDRRTINLDTLLAVA